MSNTFYTSVEKRGGEILWRGYDNGRAFTRAVKFQPVLYIPTKEETEYRSMYGRAVKPKLFGDVRAMQEFVDRYKDVENIDIFGNIDPVSQFIYAKYPGHIDFDINLINIFNFDIEVDITGGAPKGEEASKPITSISCKSSKSDMYWMFGLKDYDKALTETPIDPANITYLKYSKESELLLAFIRHWERDYPEIVTGWNVEYFDIRYLIDRIKVVLGEETAKRLSPWNYLRKITKRSKFGKEQSTYVISGVSVIDYMDAFIKFGYKYGKQETYKLDHIAHVVLGEKKLSYDEYSGLNELYAKNPQKYHDYNLKDTYLIQRMEDVTGLLALVLTVAFKGGVNFKDAFGTTHIWETFIYRVLAESNTVAPIKRGGGATKSDFEGGYVKEPIPGMYSDVVSFDLASLYPHLMMQFNMSPETYVKDHVESVSPEMVLDGAYQNETPYAVAANGACFRKDQLGVIPAIIKGLYAERKQVKNEMLVFEEELERVKDELKKRGLK